MIWEFNEKSLTWLYGTKDNGAGIYFDEEDRYWWGNICHSSSHQGMVCAYGPFDTLDEAKIEIRKELKNLNEKGD